MAVDWERAEVSARRAYELSRARRGAVLAAPLGILAAIAGMLGDVPTEAAVVGAMLYLVAAVFYWRGQQFGAAVLPGVAAGLVPLAFGLLMRAHGCMGGSCMTVCIPVCAGSGAIAGLLIVGAAMRKSMRSTFLIGGGTLALLTGTLGCACIGFGGIVGLAAGVTIPVVAGLGRFATVRTG